MTQFDPLADKAYATRIANLGEHRNIIAQEDIFNEHGALLVKKGALINGKVSDQVIKFKLLKPLESSIDIANGLSAQDIYRSLLVFLEKYPELYKIHKDQELEKPFRQIAMEACHYPLIRQKLTVMQAQMPQLYAQTIIVSWHCLAISKTLSLTQEGVNHCVMAALCHDLGMLHINPDVINKSDELTPEEWRQIQAHTVIGQKMLSGIPNLSPRIARIVLEHHERCDGTGYPLGKTANALTQESQLIALCESTFTVFNKKLHHKNRSLRDMKPFLQIHRESFFYENYTAYIKTFNNIKTDQKSFINDDNIDNQIDFILKKDQYISMTFNSLELVLSNISANCTDNLISSAHIIATRINRTLRGSGILDEGYIRWLQQVRNDKINVAYREVADVSLMVSELEWEISRIKKNLDLFITQGPETDIEVKNMIKDGLSTTDDFELA